MNRRVSIVVSGLLALLMALTASAQLPDSPVGRRGNAILKVLRKGPEAATAAFFEENFTPELLAEETAGERAERLAATLGRFGGIQLQGVQKTGAFSATILGTSAATGTQVEIKYSLEEEEPHRITYFDIGEAGAAIEPMPIEALAASVEEHLEQLVEDDKFSGVALVAHGEEILFEGAFGLANRRYEALNTTETPFNLGSINKIFTRVALAQLASEGKLSFDDTIADHLPDYPNAEVAQKVTIARIADHTSGLGDIFTDEFAAANKSRFVEASDYFALFAENDLLFEPGEGRQYSNAGYMVLGVIVEAASGMNYHDYVRENIFEPAGMASTAPYTFDDPATPFATPYTRLGDDHEMGPLRDSSARLPYKGTSAGGGFSTAHDLLAFRNALFDHVLLDPRYTAWIVTDQLPDDTPDVPADSYGIGVAGGGPGVNAALEMDREWTVVVLANMDPPAAGEVAAHIRTLVQAVERYERDG
jgi:CubicO group peptidase (beta-lactamase class C family)